MNDHLAQIEDKISQHEGKKKIIVGIDGYSGIGKTTILEKLVERNSRILAVHRDDFLIPRRVYVDMIAKAEDKSVVFETEILDTEKIRSLINAFRMSDSIYQTTIFNSQSGECDIIKKYDLSKRILVIEGIFLFHPKQLNDIFDLRIFLDGDMDAADQRRIKREKEKWGKNYFPDDHPDSWFKYVKIAFGRYLKVYKPKEFADLIISI